MSRDNIVSDAHEKIKELIEYDLKYIDALSKMLDCDQDKMHWFFITCHMRLYEEAMDTYMGVGS